MTQTKAREVYSRAYDNFAEAIRVLGKNVASERDIIADRNRTPMGEGSWNMCGFTRSARIYAEGQKPLLVLDSPLLALSEAKKAVESNGRGEVYHVDASFYKSAVKKARKRNGVMQLPSRETFQISLDDNFDVLEFVAGKRNAKTYIKRLSDEKDINTVVFYVNDAQESDNLAEPTPFVQQSWFDNLADGPDFDDDSWVLYGSVDVFGVREVSAKGANVHDFADIKEKGKVYAPSAEEVRRYSQRFVPEAAKIEFEAGLKGLWQYKQ